MRRVRFPIKRRLGIKAYDLGLPAPPKIDLPPGVENEQRLVTQAKNAQNAGDWLTAGAFWHLAALAMPEDRRPTVQASLMDASFAQSPRLPGDVIYRNQPTPVGVPVVKSSRIYPKIWRDILQSERDAPSVLLPDDSDPDEAALPPNQIVLWPPAYASAEACARNLLVRGRATHLFMAADGTVSQLADLATRIQVPKAASKRAIHLHIYLPDGTMPTWQDPAIPETWRQPRLLRPSLTINNTIGTSWGLTLKQSETLIRLLAGLVNAFERVQPVFPVLSNGKPSLSLVMEPDKYLGLISATCLEETSPDLARALNIFELNLSVQRYSPYAKSTVMESWVTDLGNPSRMAGAVARYEHVGEQSIALLSEAASELSPSQGIGALRALAMIGGDATATSIAKLIEHPLGDTEDAHITQRAILAALALVQVGSTADVPAMRGLAERADAKFGAESSTARQLRYLYASLLVAVATPALQDEIDGLYATEDVRLRALAVLGWSRLKNDSTAESLRRALADPSPKIRLYAARAIGPEASQILTTLVQSVGLEAIIHTLKYWEHSTPLPESLNWYAKATIGSRTPRAYLSPEIKKMPCACWRQITQGVDGRADAFSAFYAVSRARFRRAPDRYTSGPTK